MSSCPKSTAPEKTKLSLTTKINVKCAQFLFFELEPFNAFTPHHAQSGKLGALH